MECKRHATLCVSEAEEQAPVAPTLPALTPPPPITPTDAAAEGMQKVESPFHLADNSRKDRMA